MPKIGFVEKTIFELEGVKVDFVKEKKNVRSEGSIPTNYKAQKMTRNSCSVAFLKEKLQRQYPGYEFDIYNGDGDKARGNMLLGNLRDTYLSDDEGD